MVLLLATKLPTCHPFVLKTTKYNIVPTKTITLARPNNSQRWIICRNKMASSNAMDTTKASTISSKTTSNEGEFQLSNKIIPTLDPCVVKTKEWIGTYSHLWEENEGIFSLAQGVVYWKPPSSCRNALRQAVTGMGDDDDDSDDPLALHSYSPARGLPELIQALEEKIRVEHSMSNHDVTVTVGANQAYTNIVLTLLGSSNNLKNKAVVFCPYYFNHVMAIQMCSGPEALLVGPTDMTTGLPNVQWLKETLEQHKTDNDSNSNAIRMVTLVNPGNPTGVALPLEKVKEIVDLCKTYGVWVVLDCTYEHFFNTAPSNDDDDKNPLPTFPNDPHVIHVFSFSKGYAMAGYRCGYLVSHKEDPSGGHFLSQLLKVQDTIPIGPPRLSQHVALGALKQGAEQQQQTLYSPTSKQWVYEKYATLDASRQYILEALSPLPQRIGGSGSMYVMGKLPEQLELDDDDNNDNEPKDVLFCRLLVKDYGIATIPGSFCGFPGWIRICYANLPPEQTKLAAQRLQKGIRELTGQTT